MPGAVPSLGARRWAAKQEMREHHYVASWALPLMLASQTLASLLVLLTAWFYAPWLVLLPWLVVRLALAGARDGRWWAGLERPIRMVHPDRFSALGLHPGQASCGGFAAWAVLETVLLLVAWMNGFMELVRKDSHEWDQELDSHEQCLVDLAGISIDRTYHQNQSCHLELPMWARASCDAKVACGYHKCVATMAWWRHGACNFELGAKILEREALKSHHLFSDVCQYLAGAIYHSPLAGVVLCALLAAGFGVASCCSFCCGSRDEEALARIHARAAEADETIARDGKCAANSALAVYAEAVFWCADFIVADLQAGITFLLTGNIYFGVVTFLVYSYSLWHVHRHGGILQVYREARNSAERGLFTDELIAVLDAEKTIEAPVALALQFYGFIFVTGSQVALCTLPVSMMLSLRSVSLGAYVTMHLGIDSADHPESYLAMDIGQQ